MILKIPIKLIREEFIILMKWLRNLSKTLILKQTHSSYHLH